MDSVGGDGGEGMRGKGSGYESLSQCFEVSSTGKAPI